MFRLGSATRHLFCRGHSPLLERQSCSLRMSTALPQKVRPAPGKKSLLVRIGAVATGALQMACLVHLINSHVCEFGYAHGPSMLPTLSYQGSGILINKLAPRFFSIEQGDIVVCTSPRHPHHQVCKRVVGMPGDVICIDPTKEEQEREWVQVPQGHVWLSGDNMDHSIDSRNYGPVPFGLVRGLAFATWLKSTREVVRV
ncbi:MAG: LexA/Signal peptidase [Piptocephalis tieghemiana]|nr:MAG: LexA/Signal peptidase [Piptocephalis tieghemiana]